jgi:hypothetical protein
MSPHCFAAELNIGTSDFVLDTIRNGYVIPFVNPPVSMYFKNSKSALDNSEFVDQAVSELVDSGCVYKVPFGQKIFKFIATAKFIAV